MKLSTGTVLRRRPSDTTGVQDVRDISRTGVHEVSLDREVDFVSRYLEIERVRFPKKLAVEIEIDPGARDALVRSLLPASAPAAPDQRHDHVQDVQAIAELLWESAGRPTGTAEEDWRRAEAIVRRAVAATSGR